VNRAAGFSGAEVNTDIAVGSRETSGARADISRLGGIVGTGGAKLAGLSSRGAVINLANAGEGDIDISALAGVRILHEGGTCEAREARKRAASIVERDGDVGRCRSDTSWHETEWVKVPRQTIEGSDGKDNRVLENIRGGGIERRLHG
jgi:hypothetical protein